MITGSKRPRVSALPRGFERVVLTQVFLLVILIGV
jgi:hypothetical protein